MALVTALVAAVGLTGFTATVATFAIRTVLSIGVSKLIGNRLGSKAAGAEPAGSRVQLPPATDNKLPVIYGSAFVGPIITDAKISADQKTMWYVCTFAEHTDTTAGSGYTFDQLFYDGKLVTFGAGDYGGNNKVVSLTTNTQGGGTVDTKVNGNLWIYLFPNGVAGSQAGGNTGSTSAVTIMSDSNIPINQRWNEPAIYTNNGQSVQMSNCAFAIIKVVFNENAGTTQIGALSAKITNTLTKPGSVIKDYLLNSRYGCGIPLANIDTASLTTLDTYSDLPVYYTPQGGGPLTSQVRYRVNGPLDTGQDCLTNLQLLVDSCDSWLQYSELTGKWKVVINQSYTEAGETLSSLYSVDNDNLVGGIDISPIDLNASYNQLEVQYPNENIKDQTDFIFVNLFTEYPSLISENEPLNKLTLQSQIMNNFVQAKFIGIRRLLQAREDLVISFATDYSGIQVEAGDVIKVTLSQYGWTNKLFRVSNVTEEKYPDGNLGARLVAFEYNDSIYDDDLDITDFVPADNTGLTDPNIISTPDAPQILVNDLGTIDTFQVFGNVPDTGLVTNLDFNFGTDSNVSNHTFYSTVNNANGIPLTNSDSANSVYNTYVVDVSTLPTGNYYWSLTARNRFVGVDSNASNVVNWNGTNVSTPSATTFCNATSNGTIITSDALPFGGTGNSFIGSFAKAFLKSYDLEVVSGTGQFAANTRITSFTSNTQYTINNVPTVALSNACIKFVGGGIFGNNIQANTVTGNNIQTNTVTGNNIQSNTITYNNLGNTVVALGPLANYTYQVPNQFANTVTLPVNVSTFGNIATGNFDAPKFINSTYSGGGGLHPYADGNATTAMGYTANSTSAYQPAFASQLTLYNGDLNWYCLEYDSFANTVSTNERLFISVEHQFFANADCVIQLAPFITFTAYPGLAVINTAGSLFTQILPAGAPMYSDIETSIFGANTIDGGGVMIRLLTSSANVVAISGGLSLTKSKL
jgi:hypothetical protein